MCVLHSHQMSLNLWKRMPALPVMIALPTGLRASVPLHGTVCIKQRRSLTIEEMDWTVS
jgi:hypothetical protein